MLSAISKHILNFYQFDTKNMRTGVIPFSAPEGYGLTDAQKKDLNSSHVASTDVTFDLDKKELDASRITAMADRVKTMVVKLFEDLANFAKTPLEKSNLIAALKKGLIFGLERGEELVSSNQSHSPITAAP